MARGAKQRYGPGTPLRESVMRRFVIPLLLLCALIPGIALSTAHAQAPHQAPQGRKFVVYFEEWSAGIDDNARGVIVDAAQHALSVPRVSVQVTGFADPTGSRRANELLSQLRAQRVLDFLRDQGIASARITTAGRGPTAFALTSQESRRVEIFIPVN